MQKDEQRDLEKPKLQPFERITILMHEYDAARSEITAKTAFGFQLVAIAAAIGALLLLIPSKLWFDTWLFIGVAVIAIGSWFNVRDIWKVAARVREIEQQVDEESGEWYLLRWERLWGGANGKGLARFFGPQRPKPVPPHPKQQPLDSTERSGVQ